MFSKRVYIFCGIILATTNLWALMTLTSLQKQLSKRPPGISLVGLSHIREFKLPDNSQPLADMGRSNRLVLLYVFSPVSCPTAVEELNELQRLHEDEPLIDIRGIAVHESLEEALQTQREFHLGFPIIPDTEGRLVPILQPPQMPWKVLLDPNDLSVVMEDGPAILPEERVAFRHRADLLEQGWKQSALTAHK